MGVWEAEGEAWLEQLPDMVAAYARRWSLVVRPPFANLSYNYVTPVMMRDGREAVLKLGVPRDEILTEMEALRLYGGRGMVRLLEADDAQGVMLLERLWPGIDLYALGNEDKAMEIAAGVMEQFWRPLPEQHPFPSVAHWAKGMARLRETFAGGTGPFPKRLVETAEGLFAELLDSMAEPVLLHGDLHHYNILSAARDNQPPAQETGWVAIDPKGIAGEPAYELGAWLRNPVPYIFSWPDAPRLTARRVDYFAERLQLDRQRIIAWGIAQAVLSAWWDYGDHDHSWEAVLACAEWLLPW